ncbi:MAG: prepilin-type N-terminal cleavage/methylation domain-containing protein [bacterium]
MRRSSTLHEKGFTLIELLIVVAIIAILAAIAVPNFMEAQTRAKVSRTKNDLRCIATALESYRMDAPRYPPYGTIPIVFAPQTEAQIIEPRFITTPVAYLTGSGSFLDVFSSQAATEWYSRNYQYVNFDDVRYKDTTFVHEWYGEWRLASAGPDRLYFNALFNNTSVFGVISYDPTNGAMSVGDIYRTSRFTEPKYHNI